MRPALSPDDRRARREAGPLAGPPPSFRRRFLDSFYARSSGQVRRPPETTDLPEPPVAWERGLPARKHTHGKAMLGTISPPLKCGRWPRQCHGEDVSPAETARGRKPALPGGGRSLGARASCPRGPGAERAGGEPGGTSRPGPGRASGRRSARAADASMRPRRCAGPSAPALSSYLPGRAVSCPGRT